MAPSAQPPASAPSTALLPPVCILAGGLGTRLGGRVRDTPKPLLEVAGEPFLAHQLRLLASYGAREVVCAWATSASRSRHDRRRAFRAADRYSFDAPELDGTLGAMRRAAPLLGERFLVLYGDTYLRIDYVEVARAWQASGLPAMMTVLRNEGRWDTSNAVFGDGGCCATTSARRTPTCTGSTMAWGA